jgi:hypothetical protein
MELVRSTHSKGFLVTTNAGTPISIDLTAFAGRYVRLYSPDADLWFNVVVTADIGTDLADALGDPTTDSTASDLAGSGTVLPEYAAQKTGEQFVAQADQSVVVDPASGTGVRIFVKPTSRPGTPV